MAFTVNGLNRLQLSMTTIDLITVNLQQTYIHKLVQ